MEYAKSGPSKCPHCGFQTTSLALWALTRHCDACGDVGCSRCMARGGAGEFHRDEGGKLVLYERTTYTHRSCLRERGEG